MYQFHRRSSRSVAIQRFPVFGKSSLGYIFFQTVAADLVFIILCVAQSRDDILYFSSFVETESAENAVRNSPLDEFLFDGARLRVGAVDNGNTFTLNF